MSWLIGPKLKNVLLRAAEVRDDEHAGCAPLEPQKGLKWHLTNKQEPIEHVTSFTDAWKTPLLLVRPNGITKNSKCPRDVLNLQ